MISFGDLRNSDLIPGEIYKAGSSGSFFADEVISNIFKFKNLRGIGNQGGIRRTMIEKNPSISNEEAFVVLLDTKSDSDWPNQYDGKSKILKYYGDNKDTKKHYLKTKQRGNLSFKKYFNRAYNNSKEHLVPFFYFERVNGKDARFVGIAVPLVEGKTLAKALELCKFNKKGEVEYENYVAHFTILEVPVPRLWLYDLKVGKKESEYIPTAWYEFIESRKLLTSTEDFHILESEEMDFLSSNTGYRMAAYRKTQFKFRSRLLQRQSGCQLCNLTIPSLLVASHIVPWAIADEFQKTDINNGLLLCITHDALFDKGFISFNDHGQIIISSELSPKEFEMLRIDEKIIISLTPEQEKYMRIHRATINLNV